MRYTETSKKVKNAIFWLALYFVILLVVDIGAQLFAYLNPSNTLAIIIANGLNQGITPILLLFIGSMIAMITGYFTSISTVEIETAKSRDNLIIGLFYEISDIKRKIENIPVDNFHKCFSHIILYKTSIYNDNGLYYVLKKELFILEKPILEKVLSLYTKITLVDEIIKDALIRNSNPSQSKYLSPDVENIHDYIREIYVKSNEIITMLNDEIEKMEFK